MRIGFPAAEKLHSAARIETAGPLAVFAGRDTINHSGKWLRAHHARSRGMRAGEIVFISLSPFGGAAPKLWPPLLLATFPGS
jgi:hypothetical protein